MQSALLSHEGKCECDGCVLLTVQPAGPVDVIKLIFFTVAVTCLVSLVSAGTAGRSSWISVKVRFAVYYVLPQIKQPQKNKKQKHTLVNMLGHLKKATQVVRHVRFNSILYSIQALCDKLKTGRSWETDLAAAASHRQACFKLKSTLCESGLGNEGHTVTQLTLTLYSLKVKWCDSL